METCEKKESKATIFPFLLSQKMNLQLPVLYLLPVGTIQIPVPRR